MRHGRKSSSHRFNGHKAQVAVDTDSQLITAVDVLAGNAADADHALEVVEASEVSTGCQVGEVIGDCAYGAGSMRAEFAATGRTVVAKVPEIHNQEFFPKTAFQIDVEAGTCTCPNRQTTADLHAAKGGRGVFVFAAETCAACPLRAQCTRGQGGRTVQLHPHETLLQQARELQASTAFDEARRRRQVVEHRIARLVQLGIRQARYVGRTKTLFQLGLAAAVANLTLLAATSGALSESGSDGFSWSLVILAALVGLSSLLWVPDSLPSSFSTAPPRLAHPPDGPDRPTSNPNFQRPVHKLISKAGKSRLWSVYITPRGAPRDGRGVVLACRIVAPRPEMVNQSCLRKSGNLSLRRPSCNSKSAVLAPMPAGSSVYPPFSAGLLAH